MFLLVILYDVYNLIITRIINYNHLVINHNQFIINQQDSPSSSYMVWPNRICVMLVNRIKTVLTSIIIGGIWHLHYDHPITQMMLYYTIPRSSKLFTCVNSLSHSHQISFKVDVCHPCKLNLFLILSRLSNIITLVIIPLTDNLTLPKGPSDAIARIEIRGTIVLLVNHHYLS
jgi:hypothetical protein